MATTGVSGSARRPMRADARRNYERLLAEAKGSFAEYGTDASLEDIARRAGVGIGTLYRHFPTRDALVEAVFRDRLDALRVQAEELLSSSSPGDALATWLRSFAAHATASRGMPASVKTILLDEGSELSSSCQAMRAAAGDLLARAQQAGAVRSDVRAPDLLRLVNAIAWAGEEAPEGADLVDRLLAIVLDGLRR